MVFSAAGAGAPARRLLAVHNKRVVPAEAVDCRLHFHSAAGIPRSPRAAAMNGDGVRSRASARAGAGARRAAKQEEDEEEEEQPKRQPKKKLKDAEGAAAVPEPEYDWSVVHPSIRFSTGEPAVPPETWCGVEFVRTSLLGVPFTHARSALHATGR